MRDDCSFFLESCWNGRCSQVNSLVSFSLQTTASLAKPTPKRTAWPLSIILPNAPCPTVIPCVLVPAMKKIKGDAE